MFIDTHTHLFLEPFDDDRKEVVQRAIDTGVTKMFIPNISPESLPAVLSLCDNFPSHCFPLIGLHPEAVDANFEEKLHFIEQKITERPFFGIGETGLDFYWDLTYKKEQILSFVQHLEWGKKHHLPVIIHVRSSFEEAIKLVRKHHSDNLKGVFHCFTGGLKEAEQIIELGFCLGIGGIVTFKNGGLDKILPEISPEHILLETDSPYLAPVPYRGKRNESAYIVNIAEKIAGLYGLTVEDIGNITCANAEKVFSNPFQKDII